MGKILERAIKTESAARKTIAKKSQRNGSAHSNKRKKQPTLAELNRKLFANPERLLRIAESNTVRLTGRPRL